MWDGSWDRDRGAPHLHVTGSGGRFGPTAHGLATTLAYQADPRVCPPMRRSAKQKSLVMIITICNRIVKEEPTCVRHTCSSISGPTIWLLDGGIARHSSRCRQDSTALSHEKLSMALRSHNRGSTNNGTSFPRKRTLPTKTNLYAWAY